MRIQTFNVRDSPIIDTQPNPSVSSASSQQGGWSAPSWTASAVYRHLPASGVTKPSCHEWSPNGPGAKMHSSHAARALRTARHASQPGVDRLHLRARETMTMKTTDGGLGRRVQTRQEADIIVRIDDMQNWHGHVGCEYLFSFEGAARGRTLMATVPIPLHRTKMGFVISSLIRG